MEFKRFSVKTAALVVILYTITQRHVVPIETNKYWISQQDESLSLGYYFKTMLPNTTRICNELPAYEKRDLADRATCQDYCLSISTCDGVTFKTNSNSSVCKLYDCSQTSNDKYNETFFKKRNETLCKTSNMIDKRGSCAEVDAYTIHSGSRSCLIECSRHTKCRAITVQEIKFLCHLQSCNSSRPDGQQFEFFSRMTQDTFQSFGRGTTGDCFVIRESFPVDSPDGCLSACKQTSECNGFTIKHGELRCHKHGCRNSVDYIDKNRYAFIRLECGYYNFNPNEGTLLSLDCSFHYHGSNATVNCISSSDLIKQKPSSIEACKAICSYSQECMGITYNGAVCQHHTCNNVLRMDNQDGFYSKSTCPKLQCPYIDHGYGTKNADRALRTMVVSSFEDCALSCDVTRTCLGITMTRESKICYFHNCDHSTTSKNPHFRFMSKTVNETLQFQIHSNSTFGDCDPIHVIVGNASADKQLFVDSCKALCLENMFCNGYTTNITGEDIRCYLHSCSESTNISSCTTCIFHTKLNPETFTTYEDHGKYSIGNCFTYLQRRNIQDISVCQSVCTADGFCKGVSVNYNYSTCSLHNSHRTTTTHSGYKFYAKSCPETGDSSSGESVNNTGPLRTTIPSGKDDVLISSVSSTLVDTGSKLLSSGDTNLISKETILTSLAKEHTTVYSNDFGFLSLLASPMLTVADGSSQLVPVATGSSSIDESTPTLASVDTAVLKAVDVTPTITPVDTAAFSAVSVTPRLLMGDTATFNTDDLTPTPSFVSEDLLTFITDGFTHTLVSEDSSATSTIHATPTLARMGTAAFSTDSLTPTLVSVDSVAFASIHLTPTLAAVDTAEFNTDDNTPKLDSMYTAAFSADDVTPTPKFSWVGDSSLSNSEITLSAEASMETTARYTDTVSISYAETTMINTEVLLSTITSVDSTSKEETTLVSSDVMTTNMNSVTITTSNYVNVTDTGSVTTFIGTLCNCTCVLTNVTDIETLIKNLVKKVKTDKRKLSSYLRKLSSTYDNRLFSKSLGYSAVCIIGSFPAILLIWDLSLFFGYIRASFDVLRSYLDNII